MAQLGLEPLRTLATAVLERAKTLPENARIVAEALVAAEADGLASHGLSRLPAYADQALAGKVDGFARPKVERVAAAALRVDAATGFAFPAIRLGLEAPIPPARNQGLAALGIANSHHLGVPRLPGAHLAAAGRARLRF